jgi:REP element-mobilizing transposase RayT
MPSCYYERNLPHWQPEDAAVFLTWRLHGTQPYQPDVIGLPPGKAFAEMDRWLATAAGPMGLADTRVAECVVDTLRYGQDQLNLYELLAWVIMPNHVHILIEPKATLPRIMNSVKNFSARKANEILGRAAPFWQDEFYDHWARTRDEVARIIDYIEFNPVSAGFASRPEDWRWSSGSAGQEPRATKEQV